MTNALASIGRRLDREIVPVLQSQSLLRKLIPLNTDLSGGGIADTSVETINYTATGGASTDYEIHESQSDKVDVTNSILRIPIQQQELTIKPRTWAIMTKNGTNIETDVFKVLAKNIAIEQDTNGIVGWKPNGNDVEIDGMYSVAGNTFSGSSFDVFGNAIKAVAGAKKMLKADSVYSTAYNLTLHGDQFAELETSLSTSGNREWPMVLGVLNNGDDTGPGMIFESNDLLPETAMVSPIASQENRMYFDLIEAQTPMNRLFIIGDELTSPVHERMVAAFTQRFKHPDDDGKDPCVCSVTDI